MHSCTVNGSEYEAQSGLKTWGELLEALEQGDGPARAIVTAVRFGGVDQPSFREPSVLARDLRFAALVAVETCGAHEIITSAVQSALDGLQPISDAARSTADLFRQHDLPAAHASLAELVTTLQTLASLTAAVANAASGPAEAGHYESAPAESAPAESAPAEPRSGRLQPAFNELSSTFLNSVGCSLESLITAATGEDWISVADVLEYEIAEELPRWQDVLRTIGRANAAPNPASAESSNHRMRYAS